MTLAKRSGFSTRELVLYGLLGGLMTASQVAMAALPNIHIVGVLVLLCAQILAVSDPELAAKLDAKKLSDAKKVLEKDASIAANL